jgi:ATP-dependent 26S proteasome regulatory subunit
VLAGRKAPSIIFLDELDAIAPRRDQVLAGGENHQHN